MAFLIFAFALVLTVINLYLQFKGDPTLNTPIQLLVAGLLVLGLGQLMSGSKHKKDGKEKDF